jgi:transcriptional regulator with XRE-family HTH domain
MATRIGTFLQEKREQQGLTVEELARDMPIAASTIGQIERGEIEVPSEPVLRAFARNLRGVSLAQLNNLLPSGAMPRENVQVNKDDDGITTRVKNFLSNIDVLSIGFVKEGANNQHFLLTKQKEDGGMSEAEATTTENQEEEQQGLWDKIKDMLPNLVKEAVDEAVTTTGEEEEQEDPQPTGIEERLDALEKSHQQAQELLDEKIKLKEAQIETLTKQLETKDEAVQKLVEDAQVQKEAQEKAEILAKASWFGNLPDNTALGEKLFEVKKALGDEGLEWWLEYMKTADYTLKMAGVFGEKGSASVVEKTLDDEVQAIAKEKGISYGKALLQLPKEKQAKLLDEMRH